jgi:hypothetical protein
MGLLHPQPKSGAVAAESSQSECHLRRDRRFLGHDPMKRLARHAKLTGRLAYRKAERRKHVLTQECSGMRRRTLVLVFNDPFCAHSLLPRLAPASMVLDQIDAPSVAFVPFERNTPRAVAMNAVALGFTSKGMEVKSLNVQIAESRRFRWHPICERSGFGGPPLLCCFGLSERALQALCAGSFLSLRDCNIERYICKEQHYTLQLTCP